MAEVDGRNPCCSGSGRTRNRCLRDKELGLSVLDLWELTALSSRSIKSVYTVPRVTSESK